MKLRTLHDLYVEELKDLYDAENQLLKVLPRMAKAADATALRTVLQEHHVATDSQVDRLEQIFDRMQIRPRGRRCEAMRGMVEEARHWIENDAEAAVRDAAMVCSAQKIEHYEISGYGSVRAFAEMLGYEEDAELLQQSLDEEKEADERLNELAKESINIQALEHEHERA